MVFNNEIFRSEVSTLFCVRKTILELLRDRGYGVTAEARDVKMAYDEFASEFMNANYNRDRLTMLKQRVGNATDQIYVFFLSEPDRKPVRLNSIAPVVERMERDKVKRALLILNTGRTRYAKLAIERVNSSRRLRLDVFIENELVVNITKNQLVPAHKVLTPDEKKALLLRYMLKESQLPRIQTTDPIARYYGLTLLRSCAHQRPVVDVRLIVCVLAKNVCTTYSLLCACTNSLSAW